MGLTDYYHMAFFDFGDSLDTTLNVKKEIDRFVIIDKQIYGLYNVFGNGVIEGWEVQDNGYTSQNGISISISPGIGIVKYMVAETSLTEYLNNLPVDTVVDIFAILKGSTVRDRGIDFVASTVDLSSTFAVKLARVLTGTSNVVSIDNTVKQLVGFKAIIQDEINKHKHRGIPSKIDLKEEVKNQLPGARIEGIDASKIITGLFDKERIPILDHNDLENNGLLTHAALDSFVNALSQNNKELLGEIASTNLLKAVIFLKYLYPDVDEQFINELIFIPGISLNSFIDFDTTTAYINLEQHCVSGYPAKTGLFTSVYWQEQNSLSKYYIRNNIIVSGGKASLIRKDPRIKIIEDFSGTGRGKELPFERNIEKTSEEIKAVAAMADTDKMEGAASGAFSATATHLVTYKKDLTTVSDGNSVGMNWAEDYDELIIWVKTIIPEHDTVYYYFVNGSINPGETGFDSKNQIGPFVLLLKNYITSNVDATKNNFEEIVINLAELRDAGKSMDNITKFVIYTTDLSSTFIFYLDNIHIRRTNLYYPSGTIRYRYSTQADVIFHSIFFKGDYSDKTKIQVRTKIAGSKDLLSRTPYTLPLASGQVFATKGTNIEIEVSLSTSDENISPSFNYLELRMLSDADYTGFEIDTKSEWERGSLENIKIEEIDESVNSNLLLKSPININGYYFSKQDAISEIDFEKNAVLGFGGSKMPLSPNQAINWDINPYKKFDFVSSVIRQYNKNFVIADTKNNRIIKTDSSGNFIKGFGSTYTVDTGSLYPLSAIYNSTNYILTCVFSKGVNVEDISKIYLYIGSVKKPLVTNKDIILTSNKGGGKVLEISLSEDTQSSLVGIQRDLFIYFDKGSFKEDIKIGDNVRDLYGIHGIECFIGDFTYMDGIQHPIFANILNNGNWIVCNVSDSSLFYISEDDITDSSQQNLEVADILEFNSTTEEIIFSSSSINFSDFSLGSVLEYEEGKFMIAGITKTDDLVTDFTGEDLKGSVENITNNIKFRAAAIDALSKSRGNVIIMDETSGSFYNFYILPDGLYPSFVDVNTKGNILVSESSFADDSGRLVKLDTFGNIIWAFGAGTFNMIRSSRILENSNSLVSI